MDPITGKQRRVPLEVMRAEQDNITPFYGQARNTGLFTRSVVVVVFVSCRGIAVLV